MIWLKSIDCAMLYNKRGMLFSCESCPKGKQLTLNPRQDHMKIKNLLWLYVLQVESIKHTTDIDLTQKY